MTITPAATDVLSRNNIHVVGNPAGRAIVFAHGFGCSQEIWRHVAPTFLSDNRQDLKDVTVPTVVLQCSEAVYARDHIPGSTLVTLAAVGHLPSLSGPDELAAVIRANLS